MKKLSPHAAAMLMLFGYRLSKALPCPRVVVGRRCFAHWGGGRGPCICQVHRSLLDHGRIWLDRQGRHVLTGEPYHVEPADLALFREDLAELGATVVRYAGEAPYHPHAILLTVTRA